MELLKRFNLIIGLAGLALISCAGSSPIIIEERSDFCSWTEAGGSASHLSSSDVVLRDSLTIEWKRKFKTGLVTEPTISLGALLIPTTDNALNIVSLKDGAVLGEMGFDGPILSPCAVSDSLAVINEESKKLIIVNWVTRDVLWQVDYYGSQNDPIIYAGKLCWIDGRQNLKCVNLADGKRIWDLKLDDVPQARLAACDNNLIVVSESGLIECFLLDNGQKKWEEKLSQRVKSGPLIIDNRLIVATVSGKVLKINTDDGSHLWEIELGTGILSDMACDGATIFLASTDWNMIAVNFDSGSTIWSTKIDGPLKAGPTSLANTVVYPSLDYHLYCADKKTGSVNIKFLAGSMLTLRSVVCDKKLFLACEGGTLYCFRLENKQ